MAVCVVNRRWHTMHGYTRALYHRFEAEEEWQACEKISQGKSS